jgi:transposase
MCRMNDEMRIYAHRDAVDFRKSINGLTAIVKQSMKLDPFARGVCVQQSTARPHQGAAGGS